MTHRMFYILFFEKFEWIEMTRKVFYIVFHEVLERNQTYRKMFYTNFFLHIKISPTSKTVLSFIPSGNKSYSIISKDLENKPSHCICLSMPIQSHLMAQNHNSIQFAIEDQRREISYLDRLKDTIQHSFLDSKNNDHSESDCLNRQ